MSARLKIAILSLLLVLPTASRLRASDDPATPTPSEKKEKKKRVIVESPRRVVVDDDGVFMEGEGDDDAFVADLRGIEEEIPRALRMHGFGAPKDAGVMIGKVYADEPAAKAGLKVGDIVTSVDGAKVASTRDLLRAIRKKKDGDTVSVAVWRDRAAKTLTVSVAERPENGMQLGELGPEMRRFYREWNHVPRPPRPPSPPGELGAPELRQRVDDLERRLHELESRLPQKQNF